MLSKNINTKNVLQNFYSSMKKIRKIWIIFNVENWLWKSDFGTFWHLPITPILKIQWFHLTTVDFQPKNLSNFVSLPWKLHNRYCHSVKPSRIHILIFMNPWIEMSILKYLMSTEKLVDFNFNYLVDTPLIVFFFSFRLWIQCL